MSINEIIATVDKALEDKTAYRFLPEIRESLEQIKSANAKSKDERSHLARGLEGFVLEDYEFSESDLGSALLSFSEEYVQNGMEE